jgi:hypothetical protein
MSLFTFAARSNSDLMPFCLLREPAKSRQWHASASRADVRVADDVDLFRYLDRHDRRSLTSPIRRRCLATRRDSDLPDD